METEDTQKGVDHGVEDTYNPANRLARPFDLNFLKVDTDKAFEVAQEHGGKKVLEKDPKTNVGYLLDFDGMSSQLRWHVIYGGSESTGTHRAGGRQFWSFSAERIKLLTQYLFTEFYRSEERRVGKE